MAETERKGSCNCGACTYTIAPTEEKAVMCHCSNCQKQSSSAFGAVIVVPADKVTLTSGSLKKWSRKADSGNTVDCFFCDTCGSRVWHGDIATEAMLKVRAGTLEDPIDYSKAIQLWTSNAAPGIVIPEGVPAFPQNPT